MKNKIAIEEIVLLKNGTILSEFQIFKNRYFIIKCVNGHEWEISAQKLIKGSWCTKCSKFKYINEEKCRYVFEQLTGKLFPKNRKVLKNSQELDGYCDELKLAFEFNGIQHYKICERFHKTYNDFEKQLHRDHKKKQACKLENIRLVVIPYYICKTGKEINFIFKKLKHFKIKLINNDINSFSYNGLSIVYNKLKECKDFIEHKKGKLISTTYTDAHSKMLWQCSLNHIWESSWNNIRKNHWCPYCSGRKGTTISTLNELAKTKNGKLISTKYYGANTKLTWECPKGHIWEAVPSSIKTGCWCPTCSYEIRSEFTRNNIKKINSIANSKKIEYIKGYKNNCTPSMWKCENGHLFEKTLSEIQRDILCPKCKKELELKKNNTRLDKIKKMRQEGLTYAEIGNVLGISRTLVSNIYNSHENVGFIKV
jgi:transposase-like protein